MDNPKTISKEQYGILATRRQAFDGMLWQTPVISLTAQAFLFTIALGAGNKPTAKCISSFLALAAALSSIQLMAKHRYHEEEDSKQLEEYEHAHEVEGMLIIHGPRKKEGLPFYIEQSSYDIWVFTLWMFALAAIIVFIAVVTKCDWIL